jgi:hypothetical protein
MYHNYIITTKYPSINEINDGVFDNRETVKSLRFKTFGQQKPSSTKRSPYKAI